MPDDFYTLIVVPSDGKTVKKLSLSVKSLLHVAAFFGVILLIASYLAYDYINIQREKLELARLRTQTREQKVQIEGLVAKVDQFNTKMEELRQIDKKIRIIANLENRKDKEQLLGIGGPVETENRVNARLSGDSKALIDSIDKNVEQLSKDADSQERSFTELLEFLRKQKSIMASTPSVWPVMGWVTSNFGARISPFTHSREFHTGIDIATRVGNSIKSPADGVVVEAGYQSGMGNSIKINHGHGFSTWYGHLSRMTVIQGSSVKRGDVIGFVGTSGRSTGSHLHYGVYINNVAVNPRRYLN